MSEPSATPGSDKPPQSEGRDTMRPYRRELTRPRRVRGGVRLKLSDEDLSESWAASRWTRLIEQAAAGGDSIVEGLEYAREGQTRRMSIEPATVEAAVQGRADRAYKTVLSLAPLSDEQWERVAGAMVDQAVYAAKLLSGDLPPSIEDVFAPLGLKLFPSDPEEVRPSCSCREEGPWCKHAVCVAYLVAQRLAEDPFVIFSLRGMPGESLIERLRQRRAVAGTVGLTPVYSPRLPGLAEVSGAALESSVDRFWEVGPELDQIDLPLDPPPVNHPLLRRLGPSPFQEARFPLVGLLATCYELISEHALREAAEDTETEETEGEATRDDLAAEVDGDEAGADSEPLAPEPPKPAKRPGPPPPALARRKATRRVPDGD